jgi:hypothetical protein
MEKDKPNPSPDVERWREHGAVRNTGRDDGLQYLLAGEEQILQAISADAPLPGILNAICCALDAQIGNVVSLVSVPLEAQPTDAEMGTSNASLFGLYLFHTATILGEKKQVLGLFEIFCSVRRTPSLDDELFIDRALCLAGIAIKRYNESGNAGGALEIDPPADVFELPSSVFLN